MGRRAGVALALVLAAAAVLPQVVAATVYPGMSPVVDAAVYTRQADLLAEGDVTIPAEDVTPRTRPFFTAFRDGRWVFKYLPGTAALLAAAHGATGSWRPALALASALLALAAWGLCRSLGGSSRAAVVAAAVVALSPMVLAIGGFPLSYVPAAALSGAAVWAAAEAGNREGRAATALLAGAGALFGAALWCRQLEVLAWLAAVAVWVAVRARRSGRSPVAALGVVAAGLAPLAAGIAAFDWAVTGAPWRLPFSLHPHDTVGFGTRRMLPGAPAHEYGPAEAWHGLRLGAGSFATWLLASAAVLPAAAWAAARRRLRSPFPAVLAVLVPAAMLLFWGSWYVVSQPVHSIYDRVGPFYLLLAIVPVAALAGAGIDGWLAGSGRRRAVVGAAVVAAVAVQVPALARRVDLVEREQDLWVAFDRRVDELAGDGTVVLVDAAHLDVPFEDLRRLDPGPGPTYLTWRPGDVDLEGLAGTVGDGDVVRVTMEAEFLPGPLLVGRPTATPAALERGDAIDAVLRVTPPDGASAVQAVLRVGGREAAVDLPPGAPSELTVAATASELALASGGPPVRLPLPDEPALAEVAVRSTVPGGDGRVATTRFPVDRPAPGEVRWLVPATVVESVGGGPEQAFSLVLSWFAP